LHEHLSPLHAHWRESPSQPNSNSHKGKSARATTTTIEGNTPMHMMSHTETITLHLHP
ncbi:hypothetical protein NDU88_008830, partial [Pleurodeles waltl]